MSKEVIIIPEKKKNIQQVKEKYKNMSMSDNTALKIIRLNSMNKILKIATAAVGLVTVIDYFVPDPVLGLDEAALTAITGLLGYGSTLVNNKIESIATSEDAELQVEEINNLTKQISDVASKVKNSRGNSKK